MRATEVWKRGLRRVLVTALAVGPMAAGFVWAQSAPKVATGPEVGSKIPAFALSDQNGVEQTFDSLKGRNGMLLAFVRSADWCPFCKTQLVDLNAHAGQFRDQGVNVVSISYDTVAVLENFTGRQNIGFPMLSDQGSAVIKAFGILNTTVQPDDVVYGIPFPGIYVLDANGVVQAKFFEDNYQERYSASSILTRYFGVNGSVMMSGASEELKVIAYSSDRGFAPGRRITLVLEVEPDFDFPDSTFDPRSFEWTMQDNGAFEAFATDIQPQDGKFRLMRDIKVLGSRQIADAVKDGRLTLKGALVYSAAGRSIPLEWTFQIGQLETERVPEAIRMR